MKKCEMIKIVLSAILIVVGVIGVVYNLVIVFNGDLKYFNYKTTNASVTSIQELNNKDQDYYQISFNYKIGDGVYSYSTIILESKYNIGDEVLIRYNPDKPVNCFLMDESVLFNYLYLAISCIICIIGIKIFDKQYKRK